MSHFGQKLISVADLRHKLPLLGIDFYTNDVSALTLICDAALTLPLPISHLRRYFITCVVENRQPEWSVT